MKKMLLSVALVLLTISYTAQAAVYEVKARKNSTSGGVGVSVAALSVGSLFTVTVDPLDLWSAGQGSRWSNANGLTGFDLLSTGLADVTGDRPTGVRRAGTVIGTDLGSWSQGELTAPFGALVGEWGSSVGEYFLIGTQYSGVAVDSQLKLFYFDSNKLGNKGSVLANLSVAAVPEPETYALMLLGLSLVCFTARHRSV